MPEDEKREIEKFVDQFKKLDQHSAAIVEATMGALVARASMEDKEEESNKNEKS